MGYLPENQPDQPPDNRVEHPQDLPPGHSAGATVKPPPEFQDIVFILDLIHNKVLFCDREQVFGYTRKELRQPSSLMSMIHPDDAEPLTAQFREALGGSNPQPITCRFKKKSGTWELAHSRIFVLDRDPPSGPARWLMLLTPTGKTGKTAQFLSSSQTPSTGQDRGEIGGGNSPEAVKEGVQRRYQRTEAMANLASRINEQFELDSILQTVCREAARVLDLPAVAILLYDEEMDALAVAASYSPQLDSYKNRFTPLPRPLYEQFTRQYGPLITFPDIQSLELADYQDFFRQLEIHSAAIARMEYNGTLIGALGVISLGKEREFSDDERTLLTAFADYSAYAIQHARLLETSQQQASQLYLINKITQVALSSDSLDETLAYLVKEVCWFTRADSCLLALWDEEQQSVVIGPSRGNFREAFSTAAASLGVPHLTRAVLEAGKAILVEDIYTHPPFLGTQTDKPVGIQSLLGLPLIVKDRRLGAVILAFSQTPEISEDEMSQWEEVSSQISLAISKALSLNSERTQRIEAEMMHRAATLVAASLELEKILQGLIESMEDVLPFDQVAILLKEKSGYRFAAGKGFPDRFDPDLFEFEEDNPLLEELYEQQAVITLPDVRVEGRWKKFAEWGLHEVRGWMGVPVIARGNVIGLLAFFSSRDNVYHAKQARLAQTLANHAAAAIGHARLFKEVHSSRQRLAYLSRKLVEVQEAERRFIANELHDEIGQVLTALQFNLESSKMMPAERRQASMSNAQTLVSDLMERVRELSLRLRPSMLDDMGLLPTLTWHFQRYENQTGIRVLFEQLGLEKRFPSEIEITVYRVIQEALTNAARYADVDEVNIWLGIVGDALHLNISDQGKGFNPDISRDTSRSFGLTGIRERTNLIGGLCEIRSIPGEGTSIDAIFPIDRPIERRHDDRPRLNSG